MTHEVAGWRWTGCRVSADSHEQAPQFGRRLGVILLFGTLGMALGGWLAGYIFDSTGSYTPALLVGATFNVANLIIVLGLINRTRAGGGAPMRPVPVVSGGPGD